MENFKSTLKIIVAVLVLIQIIAIGLGDPNDPRKTVIVMFIPMALIQIGIILTFAYWDFKKFINSLKNKPLPAQEVQYVNKEILEIAYEVHIEEEDKITHFQCDIRELLHFGETELGKHHWTIIRLGLFKMNENSVSIIEPQFNFKLEIKKINP